MVLSQALFRAIMLILYGEKILIHDLLWLLGSRSCDMRWGK